MTEKNLLHLNCRMTWEQRLARSGSRKRHNRVPSKFQLTKSNTASWVTVFRGSKFDILRICIVAKPWFGILVKAFGNMVEIVHEKRFGQQVWRHLSKSKNVDGWGVHAFQKILRIKGHKDRAIEVTYQTISILPIKRFEALHCGTVISSNIRLFSSPSRL